MSISFLVVHFEISMYENYLDSLLRFMYLSYEFEIHYVISVIFEHYSFVILLMNWFIILITCMDIGEFTV
jgi:hypothetical protein